MRTLHADNSVRGNRSSGGNVTKGVRRANVAAQDKQALQRLFRALGPWRRVRETMPLQYVITFLAVALEEGRGVLDYANSLGVPPSVMSRHLQDLGPRNRFGEPGFGLIEIQIDPVNLRRKAVYLTPRGVALVHELRMMMDDIDGNGGAK